MSALTTGTPGLAQQTIFNVPSADVTERGVIYLEHETQTRPYGPGAYWNGTHYFAYGLGHNTDLNISQYNLSSPPSDNVSVGVGFKTAWPLLQKTFPEREFKLTTGSQILTSLDGQGVGNWSYGHLSGRVPKLKTRLTAGISAGTNQLFGRDTIHFIGGIEQPLTSRFSLITDWYSGSHGLGLLTSGFSYAFPKISATMYLGYQIPNSGRVYGKPGLTFEFAKFF